MSPQRQTILILLLVFLLATALLASLQRKEGFTNIVTVDTSHALKFFDLPDKTGDNGRFSNASGMNANGDSSNKGSWSLSKCNIIDCSNPSNATDDDYRKYLLEEQRKARMAAKASKSKVYKSLQSQSSSKLKHKCPPQLTFDDYNMSFMTDEEKEQQNRLEDMQSEEALANARLKELEEQYNQRKRETDDDITTLKNLQLEMKIANNDNKDMKFFEKAINTQVQPWQKMMEKVSKDVESLQIKLKAIDPTVRTSIPKELSLIRKQLDDIKATATAKGTATTPVPAPAKKKQSIGSKLKKAFTPAKKKQSNQKAPPKPAPPPKKKK